MAQEKPNPANYYISVAGAGAFWAVRINDVTVWDDFQANDNNLSVPVNFFLKQGRNEIDVTFVSVAGSPIEYNVANPDYYFEAGLDRVDLVSRESRDVTLLNLALDQADNTVISPEITKFGLPVEMRTSPPMKIGGNRQDQAPLIDGWGSQWVGRRITAEFEISDPLPEPPWASAPVIEDTPETRAKLLGAYHRLHAVFQSGDLHQIQSSYELAWQHIAAAMNYDSLEQYLEKVAPFRDLDEDASQGIVLQPLDLVLGPNDFQIERMAGGRLIRIIPDPIIWGTDGEFVKGTNVAFFEDPDGNLQIGAVLY